MHNVEIAEFRDAIIRLKVCVDELKLGAIFSRSLSYLTRRSHAISRPQRLFIAEDRVAAALKKFGMIGAHNLENKAIKYVRHYKILTVTS